MAKRPVQVDELLVISPSKKASVRILQSKLRDFISSEFVRSATKVTVAHVDNITKTAITLFEPKAILNIISGEDSNMKKRTGVGTLTDQMKLADQSLDAAIKSSNNSLRLVKEMRRELAAVNKLARDALRQSARYG